MSRKADLLTWIDLEMSGLSPDKDRILEIAVIVTDNELNIIAEGPVIAVRQSDSILDGMDDWNTTTHSANGLIERVRASRVDDAEAESATLAFLREHVARGRSPLCGNSICQDRRFLYHYMPALEAYLHYRNLDVSSIKELVRRWYPHSVQRFEKRNSHRALDDIRESIAELKYYRGTVFRD